MDAIAVVALLIFVLFVAAGAFVTVKAVRAVKRGVERTGTQVRRTVEDTTLKAKSMQPGPVGEAARHRLDLRASIDNARAALESGVEGDPSLREALGLLDRLHEHARQVDGELQTLMEREPDRARMAQQLPEARERVAHIKQSADSLRHAALDRARQYDQEGIESLRRQIEVESGALRHWESAEQSSASISSDRPAAGPSAARPAERQEPGGEQRPGLPPSTQQPSTQQSDGQQKSDGAWDPRADFARSERFDARFEKGHPRSAS